MALVLVGLKRVERRSFSTYRICTYTRRVKAKATHEDVHQFPFRTTTRMCNALAMCHSHSIFRLGRRRLCPIGPTNDKNYVIGLPLYVKCSLSHIVESRCSWDYTGHKPSESLSVVGQRYFFICSAAVVIHRHFRQRTTSEFLEVRQTNHFVFRTHVIIIIHKQVSSYRSLLF